MKMRNDKGQFIKGEYEGYGFDKGNIPWNKGVSVRHSPKTEFKKGMIPWNKGLKKETDLRVLKIAQKNKGMHLSLETEFKKGHDPYYGNYIDGKSKSRPRIKNWDVTRFLTLTRDHYKCQKCGHKKELMDVHHIVPLRVSNDNSFSNLITLCRPCHGTEERKLTKIRQVI